LQDRKNGSYLSSRKPTKNHSQDQERQRRSPGSIRPAQIRTIWRRLSRGVRSGGRSLWIYGGRGEPGIARGGPWNLRWEFGDHKEEAEVARGVVRLRRVACIKGRRWRLGRCRCACLYFNFFFLSRGLVRMEKYGGVYANKCLARARNLFICFR